MNPIKQEIKRLHEDGWSNAAIAERIGRPSSWIWEQIRDMRQAGKIALMEHRSISLATVSILDGPELTLADYAAGRAAAIAAGVA